MKKINTRSKWRNALSFAIVLTMLFSMYIPVFANDQQDILIRWTSGGTVHESILTHQDRENLHQTVGPFSFVEINTFGSWRMSPIPSVGITIENLLIAGGVDTTQLEPDRLIRLVASGPGFADSAGFNATLTWRELSEERFAYTYPSGTLGQTLLSQGIRGSAVPAMLGFNQGEQGPRNFIGILYPSEQMRNLMVQNTNLIEVTNLFAQPWANPYIFVESGFNITAPIGDRLQDGDVVPPGTLLRLASDRPHPNAKYFFTFGDSSPLDANGLPNVPEAVMFNWNTNVNSVANNPSIVVSDDGSGYFVLNVVTHGFGGLISEVITYTFRLNEDIPWPPTTTTTTTEVETTTTTTEEETTTTTTEADTTTTTTTEADTTTTTTTEVDTTTTTTEVDTTTTTEADTTTTTTTEASTTTTTTTAPQPPTWGNWGRTRRAVPPAAPPAAPPSERVAPSNQASTAARNNIAIQSQINAGVGIAELALAEGINDVTLNNATLNVLRSAGIPLVLNRGTVSVTLPVNFINNLAGRAETINISFSETIGSGNVFASGSISITDGNTPLTNLTVPYILTADLSEFNLAGMNSNRIVATINGRHVGGTVRNGIFEFDGVLGTGTYQISYVPTLIRATVQLDSTNITDLAGNSRASEMDVVPEIVNGHALLPVRFIAENILNLPTVGWDHGTRTITLNDNGRNLSFAIGEMAPGMDVPAQIIGDRTMVPIRFVSEFFGATVNFDHDTRVIEIIR